MGRRLDKILEDIAGEEETTKTATPPAEEPKDKAPEPPEETPDDDDNTPLAEEPKGADRPEDNPHPPANEDEPPAPPKKEIPDDPMKRAEFSFKRQLSKQKEKHEKELADRDAKLAEMQKKLEEFEKKLAPKEPTKTRKDFDNDDDYIDYITDQRVKAALRERDEANAKKDAERQEQERKAAAEQAELREKQKAWLGNVKEAFGGDKERSDKFLEKVAYANGHGFGQVLDSCPVAADYLINDPMGPLVFEKILSDRATFEQVFDPRRSSPLAVYHELRAVEDSIRKAAEEQPAQTKGQPGVVPKIGRPGKQAGGVNLAGSDMFDDPKVLRKWLREHRG